jgi:K+-transporting ATPase ATPase C chain
MTIGVEMGLRFRAAIAILAELTVITGVIYPLAVTLIAQVLFPRQANGSLMVINGNVIGSELIGQPFDDPKYFWGRPSATGPWSYNAAASAGSNLGPTNPELVELVQARVEALHNADPLNSLPIPIDLVTASASGLDPHISLAAALYQVSRVARIRGLSEYQITELVWQYAERPQWGVLGEPRVSVLELNLALDGVQ